MRAPRLTIEVMNYAGCDAMATESRYELLFQCFISEQMSMAQLERHMGDDSVFRAWVSRRMRTRGNG